MKPLVIIATEFKKQCFLKLTIFHRYKKQKMKQEAVLIQYIENKTC